MPDIFDLAQFNIPPRDESKLDLSGRPAPKDVRVQLENGMWVKCDVRYDGIDTTDNTRRFIVLAEFDWEKHLPKNLVIGEAPKDMTIIFQIPGLPDSEDERVKAQMQTHVERWV